MPESPRLAYPPPANISGKYHSWKADVDLRQTHTLDCSCKRPHAVTVTVTPAPALRMQVPDCIWTTWNCFSFLLPHLAAQSHKAGQSSTHAVRTTNQQTHNVIREKQEILQHYWKVSDKRVFFFFWKHHDNTGSLSCHHSNLWTGNISFMKSQNKQQV